MKDQSGSMLFKTKISASWKMFQSLVVLQGEGSPVVH